MIDLTYIEGIEIYPTDFKVTISIDDENNLLTIRPRGSNSSLIHIKYEQLIDCATIHDEMVTEKDKSVLGRAIIGGVLTGGIGAIIGGMSGIGTKKNKKKTHYLVINYKSKDDEVKVLSFRMDGLVNLGEFAYTLRNRINQNRINVATETYL